MRTDEMRAAIVPACNEEDHLGAILDSLMVVVDSVVVVDDASTDRTGEIAVAKGCVVLHNERHSGYGDALRRGLQWCRENGTSIAVTMDADGQHRAEWIESGIDLLGAGADVILANRFSMLDGIPRTKVLSNNLAWYCVKKIVGHRPVCRDVSCGFRIYSRRSLATVAEVASAMTSGYAFSQSSCAELHRCGLKLAVLDVPPIYPEPVEGTPISEVNDMVAWLLTCPAVNLEARSWEEALEMGKDVIFEFEDWRDEARVLRVVGRRKENFLMFSEA
jgi:glycosyltransferase involved in cell wall biosynthesis